MGDGRERNLCAEMVQDVSKAPDGCQAGLFFVLILRKIRNSQVC